LSAAAAAAVVDTDDLSATFPVGGFAAGLGVNSRALALSFDEDDLAGVLGAVAAAAAVLLSFSLSLVLADSPLPSRLTAGAGAAASAVRLPPFPPPSRLCSAEANRCAACELATLDSALTTVSEAVLATAAAAAAAVAAFGCLADAAVLVCGLGAGGFGTEGGAQLFLSACNCAWLRVAMSLMALFLFSSAEMMASSFCSIWRPWLSLRGNSEPILHRSNSAFDCSILLAVEDKQRLRHLLRRKYHLSTSLVSAWKVTAAPVRADTKQWGAWATRRAKASLLNAKLCRSASNSCTKRPKRLASLTVQEEINGPSARNTTSNRSK
jgi:hypothetical protein